VGKVCPSAASYFAIMPHRNPVQQRERKPGRGDKIAIEFSRRLRIESGSAESNYNHRLDLFALS